MIAGVAVVDASVVVEFLVELKYAAEASQIFREASRPDRDLDLWAPDLVYPECASALRKLLRLKAISAPAGAAAVARLVRLPITAAGTASLMVDAWRIRDAVTPYDACYLALAARLEAPFVTADERLARIHLRPAQPIHFLGDLGGGGDG